MPMRPRPLPAEAGECVLSVVRRASSVFVALPCLAFLAFPSLPAMHRPQRRAVHARGLSDMRALTPASQCPADLAPPPTPPPAQTPAGVLGTRSNLRPRRASLTANQLEDLGAQIKSQEGSGLKLSESWLPNKAIKKRAIGHGASPSSSVKTTYSNDSRCMPTQSTSPKSSSRKTRDQYGTEITRPPATGKRLFEPDSDSPFTAQPASASNVNLRQKGVLQNAQHRKIQWPGQPSNQLYPP